MLSLNYSTDCDKSTKNAEYLAMIDKSIEQLESGKGQVHELIEADDE